VVLLAAGAGAGCGNEPPRREVELPVEAGEGVVLPPGTAQVAHPRPDSIVSVWLEGDSLRPVILHLYRSPHRFPVSFSTYLPTGVQAVAARDRVRFLRGASGSPGDAMLEVIVLPEGISEREARSRARALLPAPGRTREGPAEPGLTAVFLVEESGGLVRVDLARDGERWVVLRGRSREAALEAEPILQHLRSTFVWDRTGEPLLTHPD
jgi:hypothetical protein